MQYEFNETTLKYICPLCYKEYSLYGVRSHFWRKHNTDGIKFSPNLGYLNGTRQAWNKDTHYSDTYSVEKCIELITNSSIRMSTRDITDEFKEKCRISAIKRKFGGITIGGGRGKKGWYCGFWCDSSWELAFVIYHLDHGINIKRNIEKFPYTFNSITKFFYPDFKINELYVEIKGYNSNEWQQKLKEFPFKIKVIYKEDMIPYINYVVDNYGSDFIRLYEKIER